MRTHFFLILLLTACSLSAQKTKDNSYVKIFKKTLTNGTVEYGTEEFKDSKAERSSSKEKKKQLEEEYKAAQKAYREAYNEYRKSKEKDKKPPARIYSPSYKLDNQKFFGKDKKKVDEALKKKNLEAVEYNKKFTEK